MITSEIRLVENHLTIGASVPNFFCKIFFEKSNGNPGKQNNNRKSTTLLDC